MPNGLLLRRLLSCTLVLFAAAPLYAAPTSALTAAVALPVASVQSVFHVDKSENRNQVHYAIRVDDACRPVGARPVYGYWLELMKGPSVTSQLLERERPAYGVGEPQRSLGNQVQIALRALPQRTIAIDTFRVGQSCAARALTTIQKQPAMLTSIYVHIGLLMSVEYALTRGIRLSDGQAVEEKLYPRTQ